MIVVPASTLWGFGMCFAEIHLPHTPFVARKYMITCCSVATAWITLLCESTMPLLPHDVLFAWPSCFFALVFAHASGFLGTTRFGGCTFGVPPPFGVLPALCVIGSVS